MKEKIEEVKGDIYKSGDILYKAIERNEKGYSYGDIYEIIRKEFNGYTEDNTDNISGKEKITLSNFIDKIYDGIENQYTPYILIDENKCKESEQSLDIAYKKLEDIQNIIKNKEDERDKLLEQIEENENENNVK
jgi:hypothetical protein